MKPNIKEYQQLVHKSLTTFLKRLKSVHRIRYVSAAAATAIIRECALMERECTIC